MTTLIQKYFQHQLPPHILQGLIYLEECVHNELFTAWSFANADYQISAFWADEYAPQNQMQAQKGWEHLHPVFDLASLTKPLFLNLFLREKTPENFSAWIKKPILSLTEAKNIKNEDLNRYLKNHPQLCLDSFLSHRSGLAPWCWMGYAAGKKKDHATAALIQRILTEKSSSPGQEIYSDLNYFILVRLCEELSLVTDWNQALLDINSSCGAHFFHASLAPEQVNRCIPYFPYVSSDSSRKNSNAPFGAAHDTNANILSSLGIVSGHAGLFGNINSVVAAVQKLIQTQYDALPQDKQNSRFQLGLDSRQEKEGDVLFGHLGYTGTSFWFHKPQKADVDDFHVLLTNRTAKRHQTSSACKRAYLIQNRQQNSLTCHLKDMENMDSLTQEFWLNEILKIRSTSQICWDTSYIQAPHDISHVRKFMAEKLWNT